MQFSIKHILLVLLILILLYFPIFGHLISFPIRIWDEARLAISAFEMYKNGNFIVTYYDGLPDLWSTKPPLMIWFQVFFIKLFGPGELAIRIPSALAAFFTCIAIYRFCLNQLKSYWIAILAVLVLITSSGYIDYHASRTGDYDTLLTYWTTLSCFTFFAILEKENKKSIYLFYGFTFLAILTKSIVGLLFFPGLFIYAIYAKKLNFLFKNIHSYLGFIAMMLLVIGYYLLRESQNPGYLEAVYQNDLGGRFMTILDDHANGFWYYFENLRNFQYKEWLLFVPLGALIGMYSTNEKLKKLTVFCIIQIVSFFLIMSNAKTKLEWYIIPLFPFLAILVSIFFNFIISYIKYNNFIPNNLIRKITPYLLVFIFFYSPYQSIISKTVRKLAYPWEVGYYDLGYFLRDAIKGKQHVNNSILVYEGYNAQNQFYIDILNDKKIKISSTNLVENVHVGDKIIICQDNFNQQIRNKFNLDTLLHSKNIYQYKLLSLKVNDSPTLKE